ncbi:MAG: nucleotidyltransferase domain-containing protein [Candidatus Omnitrophota bacterium]
MTESLIATNVQKVLNFIIENPGKEFLANEVEKHTRLSRAGVNFALRKLAEDKLVLREKKAKIYVYSVDPKNPIIKQLKILKNILLLQNFVKQLKQCSQRIILFGSCARGENAGGSDIDLFVLTNTPKVVEEIIKKKKFKKKLQSVIRNATQYVKMETEEPVFYEEIQYGITLWEHIDESRI